MRRGDYKALESVLPAAKAGIFPVSARRYNDLAARYNEMIEDVDMLLRFNDFLRAELDEKEKQPELAEKRA